MKCFHEAGRCAAKPRGGSTSPLGEIDKIKRRRATFPTTASVVPLFPAISSDDDGGDYGDGEADSRGGSPADGKKQ